jgi:hypothetical protein
VDYRRRAVALALSAVVAGVAAAFLVVIDVPIWTGTAWATILLFATAPSIVLVTVAPSRPGRWYVVAALSAFAEWLLVIVYSAVGVGLALLPAAVLSTAAVLQSAGLPPRAPTDEFP